MQSACRTQLPARAHHAAPHLVRFGPERDAAAATHGADEVVVGVEEVEEALLAAALAAAAAHLERAQLQGAQLRLDPAKLELQLL